MRSVFLKMLSNLLKHAQHGTLYLRLPDARVECFGVGEPKIELEIHTWTSLGKLLKKGDIGLAEAIMEGDIVVPDVALLVHWVCQNAQHFQVAWYGSALGLLIAKVHRWMISYTRAGAQKNTIAHYDLGNDFYRLWLDDSMTYSSGLFHQPGLDLHQAQVAKYDRIIDSLNIQPGDRILEIGCGWGGFFTRVAQRIGCHVTAVMNSPQQAEYNRRKIAQKGLGQYVKLFQMDYRDITGKFDHVVSIEMIEAVGEKYWKTFFEKVGGSLKSGGSAMIQGITIRDDLFESYRRSTDFIQRYIFPGGMLLTNNVFKQQSAKMGLNLANSFEFGESYAQTCQLWREKFNKVTQEVRVLGFDEKFIRLWNLYLGYCEGAFRAGRINVGQFLLKS